MNKIKKWIIIVAIIIVLLIIGIIVIAIYNLNTGTDSENMVSSSEFETEVNYEAKKTLEKETNRNRYYAAVRIYNRFLETFISGEPDTIYGMLDSDYIASYNITKDNVIDKLNIFDSSKLEEYREDDMSVEYGMEEVYKIEKTANITVYFMYGNVKERATQEVKDYNMMIVMDSKNNTFYILPQDYMEENNYMDPTNIGDYEVSTEEIAENGYNTFSFLNIDDTTIINAYIKDYQETVVSNLEESYELLDEEYKQAKFGSFTEYENYIKENMKYILSISISQYRVDEKDDGNEYICIDQNGNYYILKENAIMDYDIMLDTYTIDTEDFLEKYNNGDAQTKVGMNVEKIIQALNIWDYKYIYEHLDETFKANNFPTIEAFKQYMKENYPSRYTVQYSAVQEEAGVYVQGVNLESSEDGSIITNNIIMKLEEGTDFVMSFTV